VIQPSIGGQKPSRGQRLLLFLRAGMRIVERRVTISRSDSSKRAKFSISSRLQFFNCRTFCEQRISNGRINNLVTSDSIGTMRAVLDRD
jgi:hypothetical protein